MLDDKLTQYNVETEQVLKGIQPKNQAAYRLFKKLRALTVGVLILGILLSASKFIRSADFITQNDLFSVLILFVLMVAVGCLLLSFVVKAIFLRKVDFDYWAFEIFSKRLGSQVLYYTSSCIYVDYDISLKHKDILEAISECTDKSMYYTYFFVQTYIDSHVVCIEITKKKPLPESCEKTELETSTWNIIPFGLAVDELTQTIAPVGWFVTNDEKNDRFIQTSESVVVMVIGGTGCHAVGEEVPMFNGSYKKVEDLQVGDLLLGPDDEPREIKDLRDGVDDLYEIEFPNGNKEKVNSEHLLFLTDGEREFLMTVAEYLECGREYEMIA